MVHWKTGEARTKATAKNRGPHVTVRPLFAGEGQETFAGLWSSNGRTLAFRDRPRRGQKRSNHSRARSLRPRAELSFQRQAGKPRGPWLNVSRVREYLALPSVGAVRELERCGVSPGHRFDGSVRFNRSELDALTVKSRQGTDRESREGCEPITAPFSRTTRCTSGNDLSSVAMGREQTRLINTPDRWVGQERP